MVGCIESREVRDGGKVLFQLGGIAVDGCCWLCEVEYIQGTVIYYKLLRIQRAGGIVMVVWNTSLPIKA